MPPLKFRMIRLPVWALMLALSVAFGLGFVLAIAAAGLFLIVFPALLVVAAIAAVLGALRGPPATRPRGNIIDADYVVRDQRSIHEPRLSQSSHERGHDR